MSKFINQATSSLRQERPSQYPQSQHSRVGLARSIVLSATLAIALVGAALGAFAGILITPTQYTAFNVGVPFAIMAALAAMPVLFRPGMAVERIASHMKATP